MHIDIEGEGGKLPRGLRDGIFARLHAAVAALAGEVAVVTLRITGLDGRTPRTGELSARLHDGSVWRAEATHRHVGTLVRRVLQRLLAQFAARRARALPDGQAASRREPPPIS